MAEEQEKQQRQERPAERAKDGVVFIGKKPSMAYVMATMTQFNHGQKEVCLRARGRSISICVDVAEIVRNKFLSDVKVKDIKIGTEQVTVEGGNKIGVSTIEVTLVK